MTSNQLSSFTRPDPSNLLDTKTGVLTIGTTAAGTPLGPRLYDHHGAVSTVITTTAGAGLSILLDHLWAAEHASGIVTSIAIDPAGTDVNSRYLHRAATDPSYAVALLQAITTTARDRLHDLATWQGYEPSPTRPLTTITLLHWQDLGQHDEVLRLVAELARIAGPVGIGLRFVIDRDESRPDIACLPHLQANRCTIDLIGSTGPDDAQSHVPPGTARLTKSSGETHVLRTWAPATTAPPRPDDADTTEVLLEYVSDEGGFYSARRQFTREDLAALLLAFDKGDED
ncbi:hypothetical protein LN042_24110 [Kitasatospora sp. RB6PN24]|uniref:hypothetical protein n=1 Tax=Kitasatospora humi TaxID=2893891 RepID=UPI001E2DEB3A|nr:hypothetical protein [Kitasatospora humi]MCC9310114.1 hypothetical protein [Kitasatospora humi]